MVIEIAADFRFVGTEIVILTCQGDNGLAAGPVFAVLGYRQSQFGHWSYTF